MTIFTQSICDNLATKEFVDKVRGVGLLGKIFKEAFPNLSFLSAATSWHSLKLEILQLLDTEFDDISTQEKADAITTIGIAGDDRLANFNATFCEIFGGEYCVGAQSLCAYLCNFDEQATEFEIPIRKGFVESFEMRKYPITIQEYEDFIKENGYNTEYYWGKYGRGYETENHKYSRNIRRQKHLRNAEHHKHPRNWVRQFRLRNSPISGVTWYEAQAYCQYLNSKSPTYIHRLPTEIEWEYAYAKTHWTSSRKINCLQSNAEQAKTPIGIFPSSNSYNGITDMLGNVEEWCEDSWSQIPPNIETGDAYIDIAERAAVVKGGSAIRTPRLCRATYRTRCNKKNRYATIGFRIVRTKKVEE